MIDHRPQALQLLPPKRALHRVRATQALAKRGQKPETPTQTYFANNVVAQTPMGFILILLVRPNDY